MHIVQIPCNFCIWLVEAGDSLALRGFGVRKCRCAEMREVVHFGNVRNLAVGA